MSKKQDNSGLVQSSVTYRDLLEALKHLTQDQLDQSVSMLDNDAEVYGFEGLVLSDVDGVLCSEHLILLQNGYFTEHQQDLERIEIIQNPYIVKRSKS